MQMFALATNVLHVASAMRLLRRAAVLEEHSLLRQHQNQQRPASSEVSQLQQYQNLAVDCLSQAAATLLTLASACPQMREVLREQIDVHPAIARIVALELPISIALNASVLERRWTAHTPVPSAAPGMCGSAAARDTPNTAKKGRRRRKHQPPENGGRQSQGGSLDSRQSLPASPAPQQQLTAQLESAATAIRRAGLATKGLQLEPIPAHGILDSRSADTKAAFLLPGQAGQAFAQLTEEQARLRLLMAAQALVVLTCCLGDAVCEAASAALGIVCCHTALPPALPAGACPRGSGAPSACEVAFLHRRQQRRPPAPGNAVGPLCSRRSCCSKRGAIGAARRVLTAPCRPEKGLGRLERCLAVDGATASASAALSTGYSGARGQ